MPVVIHDADLVRVQGVNRRVAELPATDLEEHGVPAFATVLETLPPGFFLDVELKEDVVAQVVQLLVRLRGDPPGNTVISSFLPAALSRVRAAAPSWPTWLLHERLDPVVIEQARMLGCRGIAAEWPALSASTIGLTRAAGLELMTWTLPNRAVRDEVLLLGLDAVCVDPEALP